MATATASASVAVATASVATASGGSTARVVRAVTDRFVVSATWIGDSLNGSQTAAVLRATAPGTYEVELPTGNIRCGSGQNTSEQPRRLVVEIAALKLEAAQLRRMSLPTLGPAGLAELDSLGIKLLGR